MGRTPVRRGRRGALRTLGSATIDDAVAARDALAGTMAEQLGVLLPLRARSGPAGGPPPGVRGPEPDFGPREPHPTAGPRRWGRPIPWRTTWLAEPDLSKAGHRRRAAKPVGSSLGLAVGQQVQVSMNLIARSRLVRRRSTTRCGASIDRAELVGLIPRALLTRTPTARGVTWTSAKTARSRPASRHAASRSIRRSLSWPARLAPARWRRCGARARSSRPMPNSHRWPTHSRQSCMTHPGRPLASRVEAPRSGRTDRGRRRDSWRSPAMTCQLRVR